MTQKGGNSNGVSPPRPKSFSAPPFRTIELDVAPGLLTDRESEAESGEDIVDWEQNALKIKQRLSAAADQESTNGGKKNHQEPLSPNENEVTSTVPESVKPPRLLPKYADTYELEKFQQNAMIIFNHRLYLGQTLNPRKGTMQDQNVLQETFEKFNFIVDPHLDLTKKRLMKKLKTFAAKDFTDYGCICIAVMTHGSHYGRLRAYDRSYYDQELIECFDVSQNRTLLGKPIVFLIQACRGDKPATAVNITSQKQEKNEKFDNDYDVHYELPIQSNMIVFYSSYFGQASVRPDDGSWFIQTLCEKINLLAETEDFQTICRVVQKTIALDKSFETTINSELVLAKQMPVFTTLLIRRLFLRKFEQTGDCTDSTRPPCVKATCSKPTLPKSQGNRSTPSDAYLLRMISCLRVFTHDNPGDEVALYILENATTILTSGSDREKVYTGNLINKYIIQNASNKYINSGQPCRCSEENTVTRRSWFGRIWSSVYAVTAAAAVCVVLIRLRQL